MWNTLFIEPLSKSLFFLSDKTGSLGIAIILLTFIIQLILTPLRVPSLKSSEKIRELKPELDKLKKKHKDDAQALAMAQMELYRAHGINPISGLFIMLLSFPIIIALYQVFRNTISADTQGVSFLWMNLSQPDSLYILPIIVVISQWLLTRFTLAPAPAGEGKKDTENDMTQALQKNMQFIFPIMLGIITLQSPSGLGIYFIASAIFAIMQQIWIRKQLQPSSK